jgi:hypothetical protein
MAFSTKPLFYLFDVLHGVVNGIQKELEEGNIISPQSRRGLNRLGAVLDNICLHQIYVNAMIEQQIKPLRYSVFADAWNR